MKLRLHHIDMCVENVERTLGILCNQFGLTLVGRRETNTCHQFVAQLGGTTFVVTSRNPINKENETEREKFRDTNDSWSLFCCTSDSNNNKNGDRKHIDSVFNVALEVENIKVCVERLVQNGLTVTKRITRVQSPYDGYVDFAVVQSCCGNLIHTLIEKKNYKGKFLPGFHILEEIHSPRKNDASSLMTHFDHIALACRVGETNHILEWYEKAFDMKRFLTNR